MPRKPLGWALIHNKQIVASYEEIIEFSDEQDTSLLHMVFWFYQKNEAGRLAGMDLDILQEQILFGFLEGMQKAQRLRS